VFRVKRLVATGLKSGARCESALPETSWKVMAPNQLLISVPAEMAPPQLLPAEPPGQDMSMVQSWPAASPTTARSKKLSPSESISAVGAATEPRLKRTSLEELVS